MEKTDSGFKFKKCCFTGYRPSKMPFSLERENEEYKAFENALIEQLLELAKQGCTEFYSGMAMGFDIIAAETVLFLKEVCKKEVRLVCVLPFLAQSSTFNPEWKKRYDKIIEKCDKKIVLSGEYMPYCYQQRNEYMVDNCDCVLTWYDGKPGGTRNTLNYAKKKQRYIFNINKGKDDFSYQMSFEVI